MAPWFLASLLGMELAKRPDGAIVFFLAVLGGVVFVFSVAFVLSISMSISIIRAGSWASSLACRLGDSGMWCIWGGVMYVGKAGAFPEHMAQGQLIACLWDNNN